MGKNKAAAQPAAWGSQNTRMPVSLLEAVDELRGAIQSNIGSALVVNRGDVVRLALRRLYLAYLAHLSETAGTSAELSERWNATVAEQASEGTCPDWLIPGRPEPEPTSKKKGR